jgi:aminoglycoside 6'-N-acetyltransferase
MRYTFRPAVRADIPVLGDWLETPDVVRWWGDPVEQRSLLEEDLDEPGMTMLIVSFEGTDFAYAQHYAVHRWPQPHFEHLPAGARAIDAFVGVPTMLGRGHGSAFLRLLAMDLIAAGAPMVAIDPDLANVRARAAYAAAGFVEDGIVESGDGRVARMLFTG